MKVMIETGRPIPSAELSLTRKDGSRVNGLFQSRPRTVCPAPHRNCSASISDLTERNRAEEQLLFANFSIEHSGVATFWFDRKARVIRANEAACHALGYTREELLPGHRSSISTPILPSAEKWNRGWERMKNERYAIIETRHRRKGRLHFPGRGGEQLLRLYRRGV